MEALTSKQQEILTLIRQAIETTGLPPTRAEIAEAMDYSSHNAAEEHIEAHYQIDPALFKPRADYLLKVRGMSMRDVGILDGDLLAVHKTGEVRSGQIVVARLHDEVTVKRLRRRGAMIELLPENPEFEPIIVDTRREEFAIEGLGVGVIRAGRAL